MLSIDDEDRWPEYEEFFGTYMKKVSDVLVPELMKWKNK
jgi:hypothetical protein